MEEGWKSFELEAVSISMKRTAGEEEIVGELWVCSLRGVYIVL
jgi:hypothetical protein